MGGLRTVMPVTFATYAIGMMALAGVPLFFSGFWSKDEILHAAWLWQPSKWPFLLGVSGALLTAFYMTRQVCYVFFGESRAGILPAPGEGAKSDVAHADPGPAGSPSRVPHESPPVMTLPLIALAVGAVLLSVFGTPAWPWFHDYLSGHAPHARVSVEVSVVLTMLLSTFIVATGIGLGWWLYGRRPIASAEEPDALERLRPDWFAVLRDKFYIDELYEISAVRWNAAWARFSDWLDRTVWDGAVRAVARVAVGLSWLNRLIDEFVVNRGFDQGCGGLRHGARLLSLWQNGQVQRYLRVIGLALVVLAVVFIWGCK
jgi:NADH-quinone oxidoreductase subunit L